MASHRPSGSVGVKWDFSYDCEPQFSPNMECSEIQITDKEKHSAALNITSAYFSALEGYMNCYKGKR